jgi:hypothetical protein
MAEIKSTLELAMERTKRFTISEKEKDAIKQEEILHKATRLFHRYREGYLSLNDVLKEIERMESRAAMTVREYLLSHWIDALSLTDENERILKGIESLKRESVDEAKQRLNRLLSQYQSEREQIKKKTEADLIEALKKDGIWGSAVEPNLEGSEPWKKENKNLGQSYRMKLEEIKEQLRQL